MVERLAKATGEEVDSLVATLSPTPAEVVAVGLELGVLKEHTGSVHDIRQRELMALAGVFEIARHWWRRDDNTTRLGDLMKTMPNGDAARIDWFLKWGGCLPSDGDGSGE